MTQKAARLETRNILVTVAIVAFTVIALLLLGRTPICECGSVKLWHNDIWSSENSQHIADWYSPSHLVHGILAYGAFAWLFGRLSIGLRFNLAVLVEAVWEVGENTNYMINRYRTETIALNYYGDSVINSFGDMLFMIAGFVMASRLPVWFSVAVALGLELLAGFVIRDNLTLNAIMLLYPSETIKTWQMGN